MSPRKHGATGRPGWMGTGMVLLLCAAPTASFAQPTAPPRTPGDATARPVSPRPPRPQPWAAGVSATKRATALRFFRAGNYFFGRSQYAKAQAEYRKAIPHWDHPAIRYNMAVCLIHLDRYLEAHRSMQRALRYGAAPLGAQLHSQALTSHKLLLGRLARIRVSCSEPDAQVSVGGAPPRRCDAMKTRWVMPGKHVVVAKKAGFLTATQSPILLGGRITRVRVKLLRVEAAFKMKRRWARWMPWTTLGVGAAVAAASVALLVLARSDIKDYDAKISALCADSGCAPGTVSTSITDIEDRARAENVSGFVLLGLGGAALAAGITLVILNQPRAVRNRRPPEKPTVSVMPGPAGVTATLRF